MVSNKSLEERTFAEVKRAALAGLGGPDLLRRTAEGLRKTVPFEAFCASTVDPATNLMTHGIAEGIGGDEEAGEIYFERVYFEHDLDQIAKMVRERRTVELLSEATGGKLEHSLRYRELLAPLGLGHEMSGAFADGGGIWGGMDLIRAAGDGDFSAREAALLRRVAPHVSAGLRTAALRREAITDAENGTGAYTPGVLVLDRSGSVASHTPAAERLLSEISGLTPGWREGRGLPVCVGMVASAARRALSPGSEREKNLVPRVRLRARSGRWLTLYASLTEPAPGREGETIVVIEPSRQEEVARMNAAAHGLTPREEEVIEQVVRGLSTRRISRSLFISEHTVQRHLQNAFEKVGVRSRGELLKRLFFESLTPAAPDGGGKIGSPK